jgi:multiple sugar transport system permease protein
MTTSTTPVAANASSDAAAATAASLHEPRFSVRWGVARVLGWMRLPKSIVLLGLILLAPALLLRILTSVYPFFATAWTSFTNSSAYVADPHFVGFDNYVAIFDNPSSRGALIFTITFAVVSTALELVIGFGLALLLNARFRLRGLGRALVLLPWAIPAIVSALGFRFIFSDGSGLVPTFLAWFGVDIAWLTDPFWAQVAVILANVWRSVPFIAFVVLAGLQGVPDELYEAARVDGAGWWRTHLQIVLPLVMPVLITMGVFMVIFQIGTFDTILGMTGGGPGSATQVIPYLAYQDAFIGLNYGRSSALAMILFLIVLAVGVIALGRFRRAEVES